MHIINKTAKASSACTTCTTLQRYTSPTGVCRILFNSQLSIYEWSLLMLLFVSILKTHSCGKLWTCCLWERHLDPRLPYVLHVHEVSAPVFDSHHPKATNRPYATVSSWQGQQTVCRAAHPKTQLSHSYMGDVEYYWCLRWSQMLDMWPRGFLPRKCPGGRSLSPVPVERRCDTPISQQTAVWVARTVSTWQNDRLLLLPLISVADHGQPSHQDSRPKPHREIQKSSDPFPFPFFYIAKYSFGWKVWFWPWPLRQRGPVSHYIYGLPFWKHKCAILVLNVEILYSELMSC